LETAIGTDRGLGARQHRWVVGPVIDHPVVAPLVAVPGPAVHASTGVHTGGRVQRTWHTAAALGAQSGVIPVQSRVGGLGTVGPGHADPAAAVLDILLRDVDLTQTVEVDAGLDRRARLDRSARTV